MSNDSQYNNCAADVAKWEALEAEARACGANEAADALRAHIVAGQECLARYPDLHAAYEELRRQQDPAARAASAAAEAFNDGRMRHGEFMDAVQASKVLDQRVADARAALRTMLSRGIEQRKREALGAWLAAEANIENIVNCSCSPYGQEWLAASRDIQTDAAIIAWEAVAMARALKEYPKRARSSSFAHPIEHLKELFAWRTARRGGRGAPTPNETIDHDRPRRKTVDPSRI